MAFDLSTAKPAKGKFDLSTAKVISEKPSLDDSEFSVGEMVANIPGSAGKAGKDLYNTFRHPINTAKAVGTLASGVVDKGAEELIEALPESIVSGGNKFNNWLRDKGLPLTELPEENPKDINFDDSGVADQLGAHIKGRYGSWDAFKNTLEKDPVGVLTDVAGAVSGVGGATKIPALSKAGAALEPLNAITKPAKYVAGKMIPKGMPGKMYERSAKFSTTIPHAERSKLVSTALEHKLSPSFRGVGKLQDKIEVLDGAIDGLIKGADKRGVMIPKGAIFKHLKDLRKKKGGPLIEGKADLKAIDDIAGEYNRHLTAIKADRVTPSQLQEIKRDIYSKINFDAKNLRGSPIKGDTYKALARGAKDSLEDVAPEIKNINRQMGDLLELQPNLQRAANRIENNNVIPLNAPVNIMAGSTAGPGGAAAGVLASLLESAKPRAIAAQGLHNIQNMSVLDMLKNNPGMAQARLAAIMAGRQEQEASNTNR